MRGARPEPKVRIEGIGVRALPDRRRVYVAVDLAPLSPAPCCPRLELAVEAPSGRQVCNATLVECDRRAVDLTLHLPGEPEPGEHTLHVGLFCGETLLHHERRGFSFPTGAHRSAPFNTDRTDCTESGQIC